MKRNETVLNETARYGTEFSDVALWFLAKTNGIDI